MILVVGVACLLVGVVLGRLSRRSKALKPVCGCRHHLSFHGQGGQCGMKVERYPHTCGCQRYIQRDESAFVALFGKDLMP